MISGGKCMLGNYKHKKSKEVKSGMNRGKSQFIGERTKGVLNGFLGGKTIDSLFRNLCTHGLGTRNIKL